ncbi:hypothetical protein HOD88_02400 [archaeon]|jgi:hypothetical protein|nr:hypothetical protein [archaeon]
MLNKKGQLSDAMTWVVATVIIVILLVVFVYASGVLGKANKIETGAKSLLIDDVDENVNYFYEKTKIAYLVNDENKNEIDSWVKEEIK